MSDLLQIFTGNPLTTFVGKKVEAATKPELDSEDWALNIEICDIINENDDDAKDAARAIKKRLQQIEQDRNFLVTNRTLTLLDTCVSNCSRRFHALVMTKDFIQDLVKLIGPKNNPPIELQERVLGLIERWADAFRNQPDLGGVVSVYNELKTKGVTFPPRDPSSRVPIQTPQRSVPQRQETRPVQSTMPRPGIPTGVVSQIGMAQPLRQQPPGQVVLEGEGYNKISQDLIVVQTSVEMFTDVLNELESPKCDKEVWTLADEMSATCQQMKDRMVDLIERVANEDLTIELLRLNDELNNLFNKYERVVRNHARPDARTGERDASRDSQQTTAQPSSESGARADSRLPGVSSGTLNELSLIDFNASGSGDGGGAAQTKQPEPQSKITVVPASARPQPSVTGPTASDPFDTANITTERSLASSLNKVSLGASSGPSGAEPGSGALTSKGKVAGKLPEEVSSVREQDFAEIENWLSTDSGRNVASLAADLPSIEPISIPNSQFDDFIASRALAGSSAAPSQQQQITSDQQKKPEPSA